MRPSLELPRMSIAERDRRWSHIRTAMKERGIDCLVLWGWPAMWDFNTANARYLSPVGGNAENNTLIFPLEGEPTTYVFMPTFVDYWKRAQDWVPDVRSRRGTWAETVIARIKELGFERATIGMDGIGGPLDPDGWLPYSVHESVTAGLPDAHFVGLDDLLESTRSLKSAEELDMLGQAARLGDKMLEACAQGARPGVRESEVYADMMRAMIADGGEEPTLFLWACDRYPLPHPFRVPTARRMEKGDLITCEIHPKTGGYFTHVERTFCLGAPQPETQRIHDVCVSAFQRGMQLFGPGKSISASMSEVKRVVDEAKLGVCELGIHGHGLASLEYPRYRFHALKADQAALATTGDSFKSGMVFAFNIDLVDPKWRGGETGAVFADTVVITDTGARYMHSFPQTLHRIPV